MARFFCLLLPLVFAFAGCKTLEVAPPVTDETREASMAELKDVKIQGLSLKYFAHYRTAYLMCGIDFPEDDIMGEETTIGFEGKVVGDHSFGTAVAIDRRGYFLTAAHCVSSNPELLKIAVEIRDKFVIRNARVVFMGTPETKTADFAIVHIAEPLEHVFEWADNLQEGDKVMVLGSRGGQDGPTDVDFTMVTAGGVLNGIGEFTAAEPRFQQVRHSVPLNSGNSGGPLVRDDGRLVAINYGGEFRKSLAQSPKMTDGLAIRPKMDWLKKVIEEDAKGQSR